MRKPRSKFNTVEEFFTFVGLNEGRFEYAHGEILAMAGPTQRHEDIADAFVDLVNSRLKDQCRASKGRYVVTPSDTYRIPDVVVWCGLMQTVRRASTDLISNPSVLVEIVSPESSTRDYREKLAEYKAIGSLQHYLIIEQDRPEVTVWTRHGEFWRKEEILGYDALLDLASLQLPFKLSEIY